MIQKEGGNEEIHINLDSAIEISASAVDSRLANGLAHFPDCGM